MKGEAGGGCLWEAFSPLVCLPWARPGAGQVMISAVFMCSLSYIFFMFFFPFHPSLKSAEGLGL